MARYNANRRPESWEPVFRRAALEAPQKWLIGFGNRSQLRSVQKRWCLFLRSVKERPMHPLNEKLAGLRHRTKIQGLGLWVVWEPLAEGHKMLLRDLLQTAAISVVKDRREPG